MCKMTLSLKKNDRLEGVSNFIVGKLRLQMLLEEVNL